MADSTILRVTRDEDAQVRTLIGKFVEEDAKGAAKVARRLGKRGDEKLLKLCFSLAGGALYFEYGKTLPSSEETVLLSNMVSEWTETWMATTFSPDVYASVIRLLTSEGRDRDERLPLQMTPMLVLVVLGFLMCCVDGDWNDRISEIEDSFAIEVV